MRGSIAIARSAQAKLPCKWAHLEVYLHEHTDVPRAHPSTPEPSGQPDPGAVRIAFTPNELRSVHDEVTNALGRRRLPTRCRKRPSRPE